MAKIVCRWCQQKGGEGPEAGDVDLCQPEVRSPWGPMEDRYGLPSKFMGVRDIMQTSASAWEAIWTLSDENGVASQKSKILPRPKFLFVQPFSFFAKNTASALLSPRPSQRRSRQHASAHSSPKRPSGDKRTFGLWGDQRDRSLYR